MKKVGFIVVSFLFALVFVGCNGNDLSGAKERVDEANDLAGKVEEKVGGIGAELGEMTQEKIAQMIQGQEKMKCTYKMKSEEVGMDGEVEIFIDGQKYKMVSQMGGKKFHAVFNGEEQYSWMEGEKQGMKMSMKCMEGLGEEVQNQEQNQERVQDQEMKSAQELLSEQLDVKCEKVGSVTIEIPKDVNFIDQCEMLQNQMQQMQQLQQGMPDDVAKQMQKMKQGM